MKSMKYSTLVCIFVVSFILSVPLAYSAQLNQPIPPKTTPIPARQGTPQDIKQIPQDIKQMNAPAIIITSPKTGDVLNFDKSYPLTWKRSGEGEKAPYVSVRVFLASNPMNEAKCSKINERNKHYNPFGNNGSFMVKLDKCGEWKSILFGGICNDPSTGMCEWNQVEDPNKEYFIKIQVYPCPLPSCSDEVKVKIINQ